jgi:hypothetical protein
LRSSPGNARVRLVNRQLKEAHQRLDTLTAHLIPTEAEPGRGSSMTWRSSHHLPGVGRIVLATLIADAFDALQRRDYAARALPQDAQSQIRPSRLVELRSQPGAQPWRNGRRIRCAA